ncbi:MAG TPA: aminotransferase class I/II-fold pyridoxal phosphate-dependent enzyme, partial [Opitutaceae bacterium]
TEFTAWIDARVAHGTFPFSKRLVRAPGPESALKYLDGTVRSGMNFSSQDYLGLAAHPEIARAACEAIGRYGLHSAGSTALAGTMDFADELEAIIAEHLRTPYVTLYPTGWAAGYGVSRGLVRSTDHVVIDALAHNCLQEGAAASTRNVHLFRHLDAEHAREKLANIRAKDPNNGILLITESLFSMDADTPNLAELQALCREFDALLMVDVAHDLGCMGPLGTGHIGLQDMLGKVDIVMGSFSKTFASNGGFVASHRREIREYFRYLSPSNTFSNALSPAQIATISAAFRIVRSAEGDTRRAKLLSAINALRDGLTARGTQVLGAPSPIVPVLIGRDDVARMATKIAGDAGVLANLVEYPAVSRNTARFRMQVMSAHESAACEAAAAKISDAISRATELCAHRPTS